MSITELMIAFAVLSLTLVFGLQVYAFNQDSLSKGMTKEKMLDLAITKLKEAEEISKNDFESLVSTTYVIDLITIETNVDILDPFTKEVNVIAGEVILSRIFYDMDNKEEQSSCALHFSKPWNEPVITEAVSLSGSSSATSIKVQDGIAYVSANSAKASDPDLYVFDISDSSDIRLLSSLNTGPGVSALGISWPYVFLANTSVNAQLQVVDITVPSNPILKTGYKLPGGWKDIGYVGNSIAVRKNIVALGTKKSDGPELHFIDIENIEAPKEKSSYEFNTSINALWLNSRSVLVATPSDEELTVISLSDISSPSYLGGFNAQGLSGNGKSLYQLNNLFLGRTVEKGELLVLDSSNESSPQLISSTTLETSINSIFARGGYIFLGTINPLAQFQVWKEREEENPVFVSKLALSGKATGIDCNKESIFVTTSGQPSLYSIGAVTP